MAGGRISTTDARATKDAIFGGRVVLRQPARGHGYRVNADALLLADFAGDARTPSGVAKRVGLVVDLGAGVGAIALVMLARALASRCVLVDADEAACDFARSNAMENGAGDAVEVVCGDVAIVARARRGIAPLVVCNPPYFEPGTGRVSKSHGGARFGTLDRFTAAARDLLGRRGRACFVYPASSLARLIDSLRASGLEPKRLRFVHGTVAEPARVVLVETRASKPGGLVVMPPLIERSGHEHVDYTEEMARLLGLGRITSS